MKIYAVDGLQVELDDDHWKSHIIKGHPELMPHRELAIETLRNLDGVYRSKRDPSTRIYARRYRGIRIGETLVEEISLRVIVREDNGSIVTAYFAAAMWRGLGERIWPS